MAEQVPSVPDAVETPTEEPTAPEPPVSDPTKLIRIASMTRAVLEEIRSAPLDPEACRRILEIHRTSLDELREVLSDDLREEFDEIFAKECLGVESYSSQQPSGRVATTKA